MSRELAAPEAKPRPARRPGSRSLAACTIISRNYLSHARILARTFLEPDMVVDLLDAAGAWEHELPEHQRYGWQVMPFPDEAAERGARARRSVR